MPVLLRPLFSIVLGGALCAASPVMPEVRLSADEMAVTPSLAPIVESVAPGVVSISVSSQESLESPVFTDPFFRQFFDFLPHEVPLERFVEASGSGVIVDAEAGLVLTNAHVLEYAKSITVHLSDGRDLRAEIRGIDEETDIAALSIDAENLEGLVIGRSRGLRVGDYVLAVGNPFGLEGTVTLGIVSALGRTGLGIEGYEDFIQVDAAINPGNSGGALVNLRGELVGINTAIAGPTGGNVGIGFAIPIDMAMQVALQLVENGRVERGQIGIMIQDLDPDLAEAFGVADTGGVLIADIVPGSPAEVAGLKPGDIVVAVDNDSVDDAAELRLAVSFKQPGATVRLGLIREGRPQSMRVTLGRAVGSQVEANRGGPSVPATGRLDGATLRSVPADEGSGGRRSGVLVEDLDAASPLSAAGVRPGDVIVEAGGKPVHSPQELDRRARQSDGPLILRIYRAGRAYFTTIG